MGKREHLVFEARQANRQAHCPAAGTRSKDGGKVIGLPPKKKYSVQIEVTSIRKGEPVIIAPSDLPPYREHLSQAFARFFMRVGLPADIPPFR